MNTITQIDCQYITPNKTIETIAISDYNKEKIIFVYNYKGISYRVFRSKNRLEGFWRGLNDGDLHFNSEIELDYWLESFKD